MSLNDAENTSNAASVLARHCPRLGHNICFSYCMQAGADLARPCNKILDCWWEIFDIQSYLQDTLPEDAYAKLVNQTPADRFGKLWNVIEKALDDKNKE